jgi:hypothetical protein
MRRRQGFHSNLTVSSALRYHSTSLSNWYNLSLIFTCTNGGESKKGSQKSPFLAINSKGGESIKPKSKRTAPPPNFTCVSKIFQFVSCFQLVCLFSIGTAPPPNFTCVSKNFQLVSCYVNLFNWYVYFQLVYLKIDFKN